MSFSPSKFEKPGGAFKLGSRSHRLAEVPLVAEGKALPRGGPRGRPSLAGAFAGDGGDGALAAVLALHAVE